MPIIVGNPAVGDFAKDLLLPSTSEEPASLILHGGKPVVLLFYPSEHVWVCAEMLVAFRDAWENYQARGVRVMGISLLPQDQQKAFVAENALPFSLLSDAEFRVSALYGALKPKDPKAAAASTAEGTLEMNALRRTFLIAPDMRILKIYENPAPASHAEQVINDIDALILHEPPRRMLAHAPILLVPNVLPPETCTRLIQVWHEQGNEDSGFMRQVDGKTVGMYDYSHKIRRDHFMKPGPDLNLVKKHIANRLLPKIKDAFNYDVTRFEDFRIACYDAARGGYFRPHRDNTTDGTAHRRFAMSLLLNNDYEGGTLRFPEFALHEYRPEAGGAVVFSCSLLHEATDVTAGRRFVLLTFFYGEKEAKIRDEYNRRSGGTYRASEGGMSTMTNDQAAMTNKAPTNNDQ